MQNGSYEVQGSLSSEVLDAYGLLQHEQGERASEALQLAVRHICETVERRDTGWLIVYSELAEAAKVEPKAVALVAAQEAVELVICGYLTEEQ
jgi:hypothetical protein